MLMCESFSKNKSLLSCTLFVLVGLMMGSCQQARDIPETFLPEPEWLAKAPLVSLNSYDDINTLWRSRERCCVSKKKLERNKREFYASCHDLISRRPSKEAKFQCIYLMSTNMELSVRRTLQQYIVDHYYDYPARTDNCRNCSPADKLARAASDLASIYAYDGDTAGGIALLQRVIRDKQHQMTSFIELETLNRLAFLYKKQGFLTTGNLDQLQQALTRHKGDSSKRGAFSANYN